MIVKNEKLADFIWQEMKRENGLEDERHLVKEGDFVFGIFYPAYDVFVGKVEEDREYKPDNEDVANAKYKFECVPKNGDHLGSTGYFDNAHYILRQRTTMNKYKKQELTKKLKQKNSDSKSEYSIEKLKEINEQRRKTTSRICPECATKLKYKYIERDTENPYRQLLEIVCTNQKCTYSPEIAQRTACLICNKAVIFNNVWVDTNDPQIVGMELVCIDEKCKYNPIVYIESRDLVEG